MTKQNQFVMPNAIGVFDNSVLEKWIEPGLGSKENPLRLIYHTTPHRGLELLVAVYDQIFKNLQALGIHLHLDVFSSFALYGWEQYDKPFEKLFDVCRQHPSIDYHGAVSNDLVRQALQRAHIFAYPSIWQETSCLALIEAMGAGCVCVHSNLAALPETAGGMTVCYPYVPDPTAHARRFAEVLHDVIMSTASTLKQKQTPFKAVLAMQRVSAIYNWDRRIQDWIGLLIRLKVNLN